MHSLFPSTFLRFVWVILFSAVGIACGGGSDSGESPTDPVGVIVEELDQIIRDVITQYEPVTQTGLGVAVLYKREAVLSTGYGLRERTTGLLANKDTLFAIGSTTKAFTAFSLAQLAEDGIIDLNRPIRDYLDDFSLVDEVATALMTPTDLVSHRSGFSSHDGLWYFRTFTDRDTLYPLLPYLEDNPAVEFRNSYVYQNLMYMTAGVLVDRVSGQSWEEFVSNRIFVPLGMNSANISKTEMFESPNHAKGYLRGQPMPYYRSSGAIASAGGINASAADMAKWVRMHLKGGVTESGKRLLSPAGIDNLYAAHNVMSDTDHYGFGWRVSSYDSFRIIEHTGGMEGYIALVSFIPELEMGVVILINEYSAPLVYHLAQAIYEHLLVAQGQSTDDIVSHYAYYLPGGQPPPLPPLNITLDGATEQSTFHHPAYGEMTLFELTTTNTYAMRYYDYLWPLVRLQTDGATYWALEARYSGRLTHFPIIFETSGVDITGASVWLTDVPSRFTVVP